VLLYLYLFISALILLNVLIGIFGQAFQEDEKPPEEDDVAQPPGAVGVAKTLDDSYGDQSLVTLKSRIWFIPFLAISFFLSLAEPFLIAFPETLIAQRIVLALSTGLLFFIIGMQMSVMDDTGKQEKLNPFKRLIEAILPETRIEIVCLVLGWVFLYYRPPIAALRCFRVFRFLYFSEQFRAKEKSWSYFFTHFMHLVVAYLDNIGSELLTIASKGGVVVLGLFLYMAYVFAAIYTQATATQSLPSPEGGLNNTSECDTLSHCFLIMLRLTFLDGSGFDYLKSLMDSGENGFATLLFIYLFASALILLNILIGIFGSSYQDTDDSDDEDDEDEAD